MKRVYIPRTKEELWPLLGEFPGSAVFSGGTDLFVKMRSGLQDPEALICLERIKELQEISEDGNEISIGAAATHDQIIRNPLTAGCLPLLVKALKTLGSPPIRNMGTIGGNICTASPAGDTLPPLYAMQAQVVMDSRCGSRMLSIQDFIAGPGRTALIPGEIITTVRVRKPSEYNIHHFEKVGLRKSMACSIVSLAALLKISPSGFVDAASLAWGSAGPLVIADRALNESLIGQRLTEASLNEAAVKARRLFSPIDDIRASAEYRNIAAGNLLIRLMTVQE